MAVSRVQFDAVHYQGDFIVGIRNDFNGVRISGSATIPTIVPFGDGDDISLSIAPKGAGNILMTLPTSDPGVAGALWANVGVVTVSAG